MNCQIFICGYRAVANGGLVQLPPHNERLARQLRDEGKIVYGCGEQFKFDGKKMVKFSESLRV